MSGRASGMVSDADSAEAPPIRVRVRRAVRSPAPIEPATDRRVVVVRRVVRARPTTEPRTAVAPAHSTAPQESLRTMPPSWHGATLIALLVVGLVILGFQLAHAPGSGGTTLVGDRDRVTERARAAVQTLINLKADTAEGSLDALFSAGTPGFEKKFGANATQLKEALNGGGVYLTGYVKDVGIVSLDDHRAEVAVTAAGAVVDTKSGSQEPRKYWAQVSLIRDGDTWRISQIRLDQ